ncbi:MAG: putative DNA-binding protein [Candidatus Acidoferrum typicum]|nr:putative DNA-binding protein [Candidatus Acidoferrum typicum]
MADGIDVARLGRLVRKKREEDDLSLRDLAKITKMKIPTLSRIERGASKDVATASFLALSEWLGEDLEELRPQKPKPIVRKKKVVEHTPDIVEVYLRADKNLDRQTAEALSHLFRNAYDNYMKSLKKG